MIAGIASPRVLRSASTGLVAVAALFVSACSGPSADGTFVLVPPAEATFPPVNEVLEVHCGTLDCHGNGARNMRVYGIYGLRLNPREVTGVHATTDAERQATFEALISIDPEVLSKITAEHGARPERWIVVTKARGAEVHKGGRRLPFGSDGDKCLTSWLTGAVDVAACDAAVAKFLPPGGPEW